MDTAFNLIPSKRTALLYQLPTSEIIEMNFFMEIQSLVAGELIVSSTNVKSDIY